MNSEMDEVGSHKHVCLIKDMEDMLGRAKLPELESNCCIYKVPKGIWKANPAAYTPKVVSIGPLHHEESKWSKIDLILKKANWVVDILADLILLENQLPYSVLEDLFSLNCLHDRCSSFLEISTARTLSNLVINDKLENNYTFDYFRKHQLNLKVSWRYGKREEIKVLHLTDLLRICYSPFCELQPGRETQYPRHLYSASQLVEAGVKFKVCDIGKSLTKLKFEKGVLTMPKLVVNSLFKTVFLNMAALEQCHCPDKTYIGDYLYLLDLLINDRKDVDILVDKRIMVKATGDGEKVAAIFNDICQGMYRSTYNADYCQLIEDLNAFYEKPLHKYKAIFVRDYLSTP